MNANSIIGFPLPFSRATRGPLFIRWPPLARFCVCVCEWLFLLGRANRAGRAKFRIFAGFDRARDNWRYDLKGRNCFVCLLVVFGFRDVECLIEFFLMNFFVRFVNCECGL